ncbi:MULTISPECIES: DNA-binding protein [unclassified Campylobacter]|uniref:DNA-binding protein n=1 Tax=unclassified Campylobacter TaxID=2593542 RepID=UPI003D348B52
MQKLPVGEAAEILGISKEAVYNRIRRGSLKSIEQDGIKFVIIGEDAQTEQKPKTQKKPRKTQAIARQDSEFVSFLLNELNELKAQNANLQSDKERLFKEKEQMLIQSKQEISTIYKERDEKLMAFLNAMGQIPQLNKSQDRKFEDVVEAEVQNDIEHKFVNINEYLSELNLDQKSLKKAQKKIIKNINKSKFIKFKNGVILVRRDKKLKQIIGENE